MLALLPLLLFAPFRTAVPTPAQEDEPMVVYLAEGGRGLLGQMLEARGVLLDPRDIPEEVQPHLEAAQGLTGLEASLTALFARNLGFVIEAKKLHKRYRAFSDSQRENWNDQLAQLTSSLDPDNPESPALAAIYHDTGRRLDTENLILRIVGAPRVDFLPIAPEEAQEILRLEQLVGEFGPEMSPERAKELQEIATAIEVDPSEDPWFLHATSQLLFLGIGQWSDRGGELGKPLTRSPEEFMERCQKALHARLIMDRIPAHPDAEKEGALHLFEGLAVVRTIPKKRPKGQSKEEAWLAPEDLLDHNRVTSRPMLLVEIPVAKKYTPKSRYKQMQVSLLVGGSERQLYDGKFPLK